MHDVRIKKHDLIGKIGENRKEHKAVFEKAMEVYRDKVRGLVFEILDKLNIQNNDGWTEPLQRLRSLPPPETHLQQYDRALAMLHSEVGDTVILTAQEFSELVQDEWRWSRGWAISNSAYVDNPKLRALTSSASEY